MGKYEHGIERAAKFVDDERRGVLHSLNALVDLDFASHGGDLAQHARLRRENPLRRESHARAQDLERFGTALVGSEIGDRLPKHERERRVSDRWRLPPILIEE